MKNKLQDADRQKLTSCLTILIPTMNRSVDLKRSLLRMMEMGLGEVNYLIYDDASDIPNDTIKAANCVNAQVIKGSTRIGQAGGRNILLERCQTPYALLMDDDTWFTQCDELMDIVNRDLLYPGIGLVDSVCAQVVRTYDCAKIFPDSLPVTQILNPLGMGCLVRVEAIRSIGAFRSYWRYRHEETELGLRMWKGGMKIVYDPSLIIEHYHTSAARSSHEYDVNSARNLILMHALNLPGAYGLPLGVARSLRLLLVAGLHKPSLMKGFVEGLLDTYKYRHDIAPMSYAQYKNLKLFMSNLKDIYNKADSHSS